MAWAIIAAAGIGRRLGKPGGKQFLDIFNKPLLAYTLEPFQESQQIDAIVIAVEKDRIDYCRKEIIEKYHFDKVENVIAGGPQRQDSVYQGILQLPQSCQVVVIHDGARPLITEALIKKAIDNLEGYDGTVLGVPVKDTVKTVSGEVIEQTLPREKLWQVQTPQVFPYQLLKDVYNRARGDNIIDMATDDAALLENYGYKIRIVEGSYENIKLTTPEDLEIIKTAIKVRINEGRDRL